MDPEVVTILILGSDRRSGRDFRDDVLILVAIHPGLRQVAALSIPRDLWVYLPGIGMQRINSAHSLGEARKVPGGGLQLLKDTVRYNLGVSVDHFARVEMQGFEKVIELLGPADVLVACPFTDWRLKSPSAEAEDEDNWELFTIRPGIVTMDGDAALWYVRARQRSSDFDRSRRQHEVLRALFRRLQDLALVPRLPGLYRELTAYVDTDLSLEQLLELAPLLADLDSASIRSRFLGRDQVVSYRVPSSGAAVLLPRPAETRSLLEATFSFDAESSADPALAGLLEVSQGSRWRGWGALAQERLAYAGIPSAVGPAIEPPRATSLLVDAGVRPPEERLMLLDRLATLGLTPEVEVNPDLDSEAPYRLIVGDDFRPCFDPTRNQ